MDITVELTTPACPMKDKIRGDIEEAVRKAAIENDHTLEAIEVEFTADVRRPNEKVGDSPLPGVRRWSRWAPARAAWARARSR